MMNTEQAARVADKIFDLTFIVKLYFVCTLVTEHRRHVDGS